MISRPLTAVFAALESLLVLAIGVAIPLTPLTVLWVVQFGFGADWALFWRTAVDTWLIGHGVDVTFTLDPTLAASLGLAGADQPFTVSIAALGFALLTTLLGVRAGRRIAETKFVMLGGLVAAGTFAVASLAVAASALDDLARASLVQAAILPLLFFGGGLLIGMSLSRRELGLQPMLRMPGALPATARDLIATALRGGAAIVALLLAMASVITTIAILFSYASIITLYESLHTEVLGGILVTVAQLALIPTIVVWTASWLVGPGFALGTGSLVSPLGTSLGPVPAVPILGALPSGDSAFGFIGILVPIVAAFLVGAWFGPGIRRRLDGYWVVIVALAMGIAAGVLLGVLAWFASGGAGPGRLVDIGPNPLAVGGWAAVQCAIGAAIGVLAAHRLPRRR